MTHFQDYHVTDMFILICAAKIAKWSFHKLCKADVLVELCFELSEPKLTHFSAGLLSSRHEGVVREERYEILAAAFINISSSAYAFQL